MAYIQLNNKLPGITGLLETHPETGDPIRELTQVLLRGDSTLSTLERELIARCRLSWQRMLNRFPSPVIWNQPGALAIYIPQLFPLNFSASAAGSCFNIGRLVTATVVFFIGSLVGFLVGYGNAIFTFSFVFLLGLMATILFKEEKYHEPENA